MLGCSNDIHRRQPFCPSPLRGHRIGCLYLREEAVFLQGDATGRGDFGISVCGLRNLGALRDRIGAYGTPLCLERLIIHPVAHSDEGDKRDGRKWML